MIAAGFSSRRRAIVNIFIETWNCTFGVEDTLEYPSKVKLALQQLRPLVDLHLPAFPEGDGDQVNIFWINVSPPKLTFNQDIVTTFYDSEDNDEPTPKQAAIFSVAASPLPNLRATPLHSSPAKSTVLRRSSRTSLRRISKTRLRYDNSQIHFEAIESSPLTSVNQESQVLTDRQKEVSEKQQATAAAMFPDIRSSPATRPAMRTSDTPQLNLASDASNADEPLDEGSRTPLAALPFLGPMDYYIGSSPTPRARTRSQHMLSSDRTSVAPNATRPIHLEVQSTDIPSSPPDLGEEAYDNADSTILDADVHIHDEDTAPNSFEHSQVDKADELHQDGTGTTDHEEIMDNQEDVCKDSSEDMGLAAVPNEEQDLLMDDEPWSELPSSTTDLELSAQIAAEIDAHLRRPEVGGDEEDQSLLHGQTASQQNVGDVFSDCLSDKLSDMADGTEVFVDASPVLQRDAKKTVQTPLVQEPECSVTSDARCPDDSSEIAETQAQQQTPILLSQLEASTQEDTEQSISDVSRVGDSFSVPENELAMLENRASVPEAVRRSPRKPVSSSNIMARATRKRKEPPVQLIGDAKRAKRASQTTSEAASTPATAETEEKSDVLLVSPPPASRSPSPQPDIVDEPTPPPAPVTKSKVPASQGMLAPPTPTVSSTKRKPGRPRKVVFESQSAQKPAASLKRRTRLSAPELDRLDSDADALVVEDMPAPKQMRTRASQDVSRGPSGAPSESESVPSLASLAAQVRRVSHVEIAGRAVGRLGVDRVGVPSEAGDGGAVDSEAVDSEAVDREEERAGMTVAQPRRDATAPLETADEGVQEVRTPSRPAPSPAVAAEATPMSSLGRVMLTPRSILGRLKKILSDCSQMVLGSQEERQFDDVLFELRTEVHAAGRRGRGAE